MKKYHKENPTRKLKKFWPSLTNSQALEEYEFLLQKQSNVCAICSKPEVRINTFTGKPFALAVDHCHRTGVVRGLLCFNCNIAIGKLKDDAALLRKAADYVESKCLTIITDVNAETSGIS
jgi:hypothetical protein